MTKILLFSLLNKKNTCGNSIIFPPRFLKKFRQSKFFTKEFYFKSIWRKKFVMGENYHTLWKREAKRFVTSLNYNIFEKISSNQKSSQFALLWWTLGIEKNHVKFTKNCGANNFYQFDEFFLVTKRKYSSDQFLI